VDTLFEAYNLYAAGQLSTGSLWKVLGLLAVQYLVFFLAARFLYRGIEKGISDLMESLRGQVAKAYFAASFAVLKKYPPEVYMGRELQERMGAALVDGLRNISLLKPFLPKRS